MFSSLVVGVSKAVSFFADEAAKWKAALGDEEFELTVPGDLAEISWRILLERFGRISQRIIENEL